mmetsp:Transcript_14617/g.39556  ORF Transcript_14617/g.39556 Transcript_14617/m.39556 type:complete len:106 (-) Transcript_14617:2011-2328(-)
MVALLEAFKLATMSQWHMASTRHMPKVGVDILASLESKNIKMKVFRRRVKVKTLRDKSFSMQAILETKGKTPPFFTRLEESIKNKDNLLANICKPSEASEHRQQQ